MKLSTRIKCRIATLGASCALAMALVSPAHSSALERMSLAKLSRTAQAIVRARCVANSTRWEDGEIWTIADFQIEETWKGATPYRFTIRLLGGTVGNITSTVEGVPRFQSGDDVVLFLETTKYGDYSVESWMQGTFRVALDRRTSSALITQDTAAFTTFDPVTKTFAATGMRGVSLEDFHRRVSEALAQNAGASR
jgi:hypothetical protein